MHGATLPPEGRYHLLDRRGRIAVLEPFQRAENFRRGKVKVELALVKGRKLYDKRAKLDERRSRREIRGIMRGERPE